MDDCKSQSVKSAVCYVLRSQCRRVQVAEAMQISVCFNAKSKTYEKQQEPQFFYQKEERRVDSNSACRSGEVLSIDQARAHVRMAEEGRIDRQELEEEVGGPIDEREKVTDVALFQLVKQQGYRCALSNLVLKPENAALDHIVPISRGGWHSLANLQWVDARINRMKGQMHQEEFIALCRSVAQAAERD